MPNLDRSARGWAMPERRRSITPIESRFDGRLARLLGVEADGRSLTAGKTGPGPPRRSGPDAYSTIARLDDRAREEEPEHRFCSDQFDVVAIDERVVAAGHFLAGSVS